MVHGIEPGGLSALLQLSTASRLVFGACRFFQREKANARTTFRATKPEDFRIGHTRLQLVDAYKYERGPATKEQGGS